MSKEGQSLGKHWCKHKERGSKHTQNEKRKQKELWLWLKLSRTEDSRSQRTSRGS
jgi:hypothetical protein